MAEQVQAVFDRDGAKQGDGVWNPKVLARFFRRDDIAGKRVLDIGANTGGLTLELARMGGIVTAAEPVWNNTIARAISEREGLRVTWSTVGLFDCHTLGRFETIVCFGLLYHFRNPHYLLDYLSSLAPVVLYVSTQTAPGDEAALVNRATTLTANMRMAEGTRGWEPTHEALRRMLFASGFRDVESLTDKLYVRSIGNPSDHMPGATNSAYYRGVCQKPVQDPRLLNETYEARH